MRKVEKKLIEFVRKNHRELIEQKKEKEKKNEIPVGKNKRRA